MIVVDTDGNDCHLIFANVRYCSTVVTTLVGHEIVKCGSISVSHGNGQSGVINCPFMMINYVNIDGITRREEWLTMTKQEQ